MSLDLTAFQGALKRHYNDQRQVDLAMRDNPFFDQVPKDDNARGEAIKTSIKFKNPIGGSAVYANAAANAGAGGYGAFLQTHQDHFHVVKIEDKIIDLAADAPKQAFYKATEDIDRGINEATSALSRKLFRDTGGYLGRMANTAFATTALQLVTPADAYNFNPGEVLKLDAAADGASVKAGTITIVSIDREQGILTLSGNISAGVGTAAANDYIFKEGDQAAGWTGLRGFIPDDAATAATTLHGLVRATDVTRLGGYRLDTVTGTYAGMNVEQALITLAGKLAAEGASPSHVWFNPLKIIDLNLLVSSGAAVRREIKSKVANVAFQSVVVQGPKGEIMCMADVNCPFDRAYMTDMSTFKLKTAGAAPHIVQKDGLVMRLDNSSMDWVVRLAAYGDLCCSAPGHNGVILF